MQTILLTAAAAVALLVLLYALWGGVHFLAHCRLGFRRMGCRGPVTDAQGQQLCCRTGEPCDETGAADGAECEAEPEAPVRRS